MSTDTSNDYRLVVLVCVGMLISLQHLGHYLSQQPISQPGNNFQLLWVEAQESKGFFSNSVVNNSPYDWRYIYEQLTVVPPSDTIQISIPPGYPAAYRLVDSRPPQITQLPAKESLLFFGRIPVNSAEENILKTIPGIGTTLASNIAMFRVKKGKFRSVNDLRKVKGIGKVKSLSIDKYVSYD